MKIKNKKELIPYISRACIWYIKRDDSEKEFPYIDNITTYLKRVSGELGIDYDALYKDMKSNFMYYFTNPYLGAMRSSEQLTHIIDDTRFLWVVDCNMMSDLKVQKVYIRLDVSGLFEIPFPPSKLKLTKELRPSKFYHPEKGGVDQVEDCLKFYPEPDSCSNSVSTFNARVHVFTTEEEALEFLESRKKKEAEKPEEKEVPKDYEKILREAKLLKSDQILELIDLLSQVYDEKIESLNLNPLETAQKYLGVAEGIEDYIVGKETAIRDWMDSNMDPNRYEVIEYDRILDWILDGYSKDDGSEVTWDDISDDLDREVIEEISESLKNGIKGFKYDW